MILEARPQDLAGILEIYNDVIATTTSVFSIAPTTLEERRAWRDERRRRGYPVIVALESDRVVGFASFGDFRGVWPAYQFSVEHTVHVRQELRGRGVGTALVRALFPLAAAMGKHVMIGGVDAANLASLRMHERLGFERVGHFREVGYKFDRWLDLVFVQRFIGHADASTLRTPGLPRQETGDADQSADDQ